LFPVEAIQVQLGKLDELKTTTASYGSSIPHISGTGPVGGTIVYNTDLIQHVKKRTDNGKGGGGTVTKTYYYSVNYAVKFCRGPAEKVLKIFAQNKLIMDFTAQSGPVLSAVFVAETKSPFDEGTIRIKLGDGDDTPDPMMEADLGVGNTPAWPDEVVIYLEDFPLTDFGNVPPPLEAIISTNTADSFPSENFADMTGTSLDGAFWLPDRVHFINTTGQIVNSQTGDVTQASFPDGLGGSTNVPLHVDIYGNYYALKVQSVNAGTLYQFSSTFQLIAQSTKNVLPIVTGINDIKTFGSPLRPLVVVAHSLSSNRLAVFQAFGSPWVSPEEPQSTGVTHLALVNQYILSDVTSLTLVPSSAQILAVDLEGYCYALATGGGDTHVVRLSQSDGGVDNSWVIASGYTSLSYLTYDQKTNSLIAGDARLYRFSLDSLTTEASNTSVGLVAHNEGIFENDIVNGILWMQTAAFDTYTLFETEGLTEVRNFNAGTDFGIGTSTRPFYDPYENSLCVSTSDKLYRDRALGAPVLASDAAKMVSDLTELDSTTQLDVSQIPATDKLDFFAISGRSVARRAMEQLEALFFFDLTDLDQKVVCVKRGGSTVLNLTDEDLAAGAPGSQTVKLKRIERQPSELPQGVDITYLSALMDYQNATQPVRVEVDDVYVQRIASAAFTIVMNDDEVFQRGEIMLNQEHWLKYEYEFFLSIKNVRLHPGNTVNVTVDGKVDTILITETELGANYLYRCVGIGFPINNATDADALWAALYTRSNNKGAISSVYVPQIIQPLNPTVFVPINSTLWRTQDDGPGFYMAAQGVNPSTWPTGGALIERTTSGEYTEFILYPGTQQSTMGSAKTVLAAPTDGRWQLPDKINTVDIYLVGPDVPVTATEEDVLARTNWFLIGEELVGATTITDLGDNVYRLSGTLYRARQGTEYGITTHVMNERVVWVKPDALVHSGSQVSQADHNILFNYKAYTINGIIDDVQTVPFTWLGRTQMPIAVAHNITGVKSGADWVITWCRCTRLDGELKDIKVDVALGEDNEEYEIDFLDESGAIVRSETGITSPTFTYTEAMQQADFTTPVPDPYPKQQLRIQVYQISAQVGRGFVRDVTFDVDPRETDANKASQSLLVHFDQDPPVDKSPWQHPATVGSGATIEAAHAKFGSMGFDGNNDTTAYVEFPSHSSLLFDNVAFSVTFWTKIYSGGAQSTDKSNMVSVWNATGNQRSYNIGLNSHNLRLEISTDGTAVIAVTGTWVPVENQWYFISVTRAADGTIRLGVDDTVVGTRSAGMDTLHTSTAAFRIGQNHSDPASFAPQCAIDDVVVYRGVDIFGGTIVVPVRIHPTH
jgi:hypothetical protein